MQPNSPHLYTPLQAGGPDVAAAHPQHGLLLCYPPPGSPMARQALKAYRGGIVAVVGVSPSQRV